MNLSALGVGCFVYITEYSITSGDSLVNVRFTIYPMATNTLLNTYGQCELIGVK